MIVAVLVRRTAFGYRLLAIGGNRRASVLAGLPVKRTLITVYALSGTARRDRRRHRHRPAAGQRPVLHRAAVSSSAPSPRSWSAAPPLNGGRVRILGTVAGAVLIQLLETTLVSHNAPDSVARIVEALIIIAAVYHPAPVEEGSMTHTRSRTDVDRRRSRRRRRPRRPGGGRTRRGPRAHLADLAQRRRRRRSSSWSSLGIVARADLRLGRQPPQRRPGRLVHRRSSPPA